MKIYGEEKPSLDYIAHFGVKGMKWGVRRNAEKSGVGRIRGAAAQSLKDSARRRNTAARLGRVASLVAPLGLMPHTRAGQRRIASRQQAAAQRILAGQTRVMDFLRVTRNMSVLDLAITTTPRRGATGYDGQLGSGTGSPS